MFCVDHTTKEENIVKYRRILGYVSVLCLLSSTAPVLAAPAGADLFDQNLSRYQLTVTTASGDEDRMEIYAFSHEVASPRDAASGLPTGKRQHKPFTVIKPVDKSTPLIFNLLTNNENITSWELKCWKLGRAGKRPHLYKTVKLSAPAVVGVVSESPYETGANGIEVEKVDFVYDTIAWTFHDSGITIEDRWQDENQ